MLLILTQVITMTALIFLFRGMTQYVCSLCEEADKKKAKAEATKG